MKTLNDLLKEAKSQIQEISVDDAHGILQKGRTVLIDVREPQEWKEGIIPGALTIPRGILELQIEKAVPDRIQEILLYCAGGVRSVLAGKSLKEMGYQNVKSIQGGFVIWEAADFEITPYKA